MVLAYFSEVCASKAWKGSGKLYAEAPRQHRICVHYALPYCRYLCANTFLPCTHMDWKVSKETCSGESGACGGSFLG